MQQWQTDLGQCHGGGYIDMHDLLPQCCVILFDGIAFAEDAGVVHETIQAPEVIGNAVCERRVRVAVGNCQIHYCDGWPLRPCHSFDFIVDFFELARIPAVQNHLRTEFCRVNSQCTANAVARARDANDAVA